MANMEELAKRAGIGLTPEQKAAMKEGKSWSARSKEVKTPQGHIKQSSAAQPTQPAPPAPPKQSALLDRLQKLKKETIKKHLTDATLEE